MQRALTTVFTGTSLVLALAASPLALAAPAVPPSAPAAATTPAVFATVGGHTITQDDYDVAFAAAVRAKFYHGKPPVDEVAKLQRTVGNQLVDRVLILGEAGKRKLQPDAAAVDKTVQDLDKRYANSEQWKKTRAQALPPLVAKLEQDSLLGQIESSVRSGATVSDADVAAYYAAHKDKFTEPEQLRLGLILLRVEPSAPTSKWVETHGVADGLLKRARGGEDFAALARQFSNDDSAEQGGDMGYVHLGMLAEAAQNALAKLQPGQLTEPLNLLQGVAVFRLLDRKGAQLLPLERVKVRARELALRDAAERAWTGFLVGLRAGTPATLDTSRYLPLAEQAHAASKK